MTLADGNVYKGEYKNGKQYGHGTVTFDDADVYRGQWKEEMKHGPGTF